MGNSSPQTVVFIAPIGAGKGTQAEMLAEKFGFFHLETSKLLEEQLVHSNSQDPDILEAQRLYHTRQLITPALVAKIVMAEMETLHRQGSSIVFSGSFRTLEEAEKEILLAEKLYGHEHIKFLYITLSEEEAVKRNSGRRICQEKRHPIPDFPQYRDITACPFGDGSPLIKRTLDHPEAIRERYAVFLRDTYPVLDFIKNRGYTVITINGEQSIEKVSEDILAHFK